MSRTITVPQSLVSLVNTAHAILNQPGDLLAHAVQAPCHDVTPPHVATELAALRTIQQVKRMSYDRVAGHIKTAEAELYRARRALSRLAA